MTAKILLIEDDVTISEATCIFLEVGGYEIEPAFSCKDAIEKITKTQYDLVITDMFLPDGDCFSILPHLENVAGKTKTILVSGGGNRINAKDVINMSGPIFDACLMKPVKAVELKKTIDDVLAA
ncbi:response regulator [Terasakiella sp. SH-1]|uniref:response regulator n=1 Tax=Terasakiella sp. SH-1 TaxID=2560057 RepID=UPI00107302AB|nr:response regulator [Terasakiella sp. SH-1]